MRTRQVMMGVVLGAMALLGGAQAQVTPPGGDQTMVVCGSTTCTVYWCTSTGCTAVWSYRRPREMEP